MSTVSTPEDHMRAIPTVFTWTEKTPLHLTWAGMMIGLFWKWEFFLQADQIYHDIPIHHAFFPAWLQEAMVLRGAFIVATISVVVAWLADQKRTRCIASAFTLGAATIMIWHQGSYNDMTFVTFWWCSVWTLWYTTRMRIDDPMDLQRKAAFLSRVLVSIVLLGGASGKWTAEYWSGEVFWEIYFVDRNFWVFNGLRSWFDGETLRMIATGYSRKVVVIETLAGFGIWLLPARWAAILGAMIFASIALFSNFLLFSVLGPLIGLSLAGWIPRKRESVT